MINWINSIDVVTWAEVAGLMVFAAGGGLLKRRMFEEELREQEATQHKLDAERRFYDPFDD